MAFVDEIDENGFAIIEGVVSRATAESLARALPELSGVAGTRTLLDIRAVRDLAESESFRSVVEPILGRGAMPVRAILFDKTPSTNWTLGWHQDTKIAVQERLCVDGYSGWSEKEGVVHCRPPLEVLEKCIALRLHLDPCGPENGPLRVLPGTHRMGWIERPDDIDESLARTCLCRIGDVVLMRPLLLHASSKSIKPDHRRVIHIEYSSARLDAGMKWAAESSRVK